MRSLFISTLLIFWTPIVILISLKTKLYQLLYFIVYEKGIFTPFLWRMTRKVGRSTVNEVDCFLNFFFSSSLKGEQSMGKIYGIRPDQIQEFEPKGQEDVPADERLVFLCKPLDVNLSAKITDQVYTAKGFGAKREELLRAGTQEIEILRKGLVGWKNFFYDDGTEIEWNQPPSNVSQQKFNSAMDQNLNKIDAERRGEIADFIRGSSTADSD